ncbi:rcc01693 family protein [Brevirhabdus sp.]|uniref:rcc01693 family protein n=1 Tax=Brevirhabdus sp. TaxID=2004514 RepID=UPI004059B028
MRAGLGGLRLTPAAFWSLSPAELLVMLGLDASTAPLGRARLAELSALYPDEGKEAGDG